MSLDISTQLPNGVKKKLFKLKPPKPNGLILNIHHKTTKKALRFIYCCFHKLGHILALGNNDGDIYLIDFLAGKYWGLPKLDSCTFIKFSEFSDSDLLVGKTSGITEIIDSDSGYTTGQLIGHKYPVFLVSFAEKYLCLTGSQSEAIIWDLRSNSKVQVLNLEKNSLLKFVLFIPVTNHILACFQDNIIQIWKNETYENVKQFSPSNWNNYSVKSITFSRNGRIMVVGGYLPNLAIFLLDNWKLLKLITLPNYVQTVKSIEFLQQNFDGGCNKILAILSGQGLIYFYDLEENTIISELKTKFELIKFNCSTKGNYIACLVCSGELEIYDLMQYTESANKVVVQSVQKPSKIKLKKCPEKIMGVIKEKVDGILDTEKLKSVLKEYGEFPESYRLKIWEKLLKLPNNIKQYNSIINHVTIVAFKDLYLKFPLENKNMIKSLKKLLNNIVTWCPFFSNVEYLPVFAFPFVKVFHNKPVACFEAVCTLLVNWCQHWFEYYPLPPVNILAMVENILMEHDPDLLNYFSLNNFTTNTYVWPLLETVFSEVLTDKEWLHLWDHILINEPAFLICAVASYNILYRNSIAEVNDKNNLELFYRTQKPIDMKRFIAKTYYILESTSEKMHPRQYLEPFGRIEIGVYPRFLQYPKAVVNFEMEQKRILDDCLDEMKSCEDELLKEQEKSIKHLDEIEIQKEENERVKEMEKACMEKLTDYKENVKLQCARLHGMREKIMKEEKEIIDLSRRKLEERNLQKQKNSLELLAAHIDVNDVNPELATLEDKLFYRYYELIRHKYKIEEMFNNNGDNLLMAVGKEYKLQQEMLRKEMEKVKRPIESVTDIKKLNIATGISVMESLIKKIERELSKGNKSFPTDNNQAGLKFLALQSETKELENEVSRLLKLLSEHRENNVGSKINYGSSSDGSNKCYCEDMGTKVVRFSKQ